jgi:alpha-galactosidase
MTEKVAVVLAALVAVSAGTMRAADPQVRTVNIQFAGRGGTPQGTEDPAPPAYRGGGVVGEGTVWNAVSANAFKPPLFLDPVSGFTADDGKVAVALEVDHRGWAGADHFPPAQGATLEHPLLNSYLVAQGKPARLVLSRLVPGERYRIVVFASNSRAGVGAEVRPQDGQPAKTNGGGTSPFPAAGEDFMEFESVAADASGDITLDVLPGSGVAVVNGLQIRGPFHERPPAASSALTIQNWAAASLPDPDSGTVPGKLPFSFSYGGKPFRELAPTWTFTAKRVSAHETVSTWRDPDTGLVVELRATTFADFPVVEWVATLSNQGDQPTPVISHLQGLDSQFLGEPKNGYTLHHHLGSRTQIDDFAPQQTVLEPDAALKISTTGGRPAMAHLPFFNVAWKSGGAIVAVGWPGQWEAVFSRKESGTRLGITAGQQSLDTSLRPRETIRTPRMALLVYAGDFIDGQNLWRRWAIAHLLPRIGGRPVGPLLAPCTSHQTREMELATTENQKNFIDGFLAHDIKPDFWWMDAGWYEGNGSWVSTGTWAVDRKRFPGGLGEISDHAHGHGIGSILWFEPERVCPDTELFRSKPEWLLAPVNLPPDLLYQKDRGWRLLDLGNPEAREWITERVSDLLTSEKIDCYRQDFNMDPLYYWRSTDRPGRTGIAENLHVQGYLRLWDDLKRRHPELLIDSCASGGRRNDLEAISRAVPLLRSDYVFEPTGLQGQTYGLSSWYPYTGTGVADAVSLRASKISPSGHYLPPPGAADRIWTDYLFRSAMSNALVSAIDSRNEDVDFDRLRVLIGQWRQVAVNYSGDYYPLTKYSTANDCWMAFQFDRPEAGAGMVQAFRRPESPYTAVVLPLRGLDRDARYVVRDIDREDSQTLEGSALLETGLPVEITTKPGAVIITYEKVVPPTQGR